jgi:alanine racemase
LSGIADKGSVLEIDLDALAANWRLLAERHGGTHTTAGVVKANGYGLGAVEVAQRLYREGCRHFFTAHLQEAAAIRPHLPGAMVGSLHGLEGSDPEEVFQSGILPALGGLQEVVAWSEAARRIGQRLPALLHVDTGMHRTGISLDDLDWLLARPEVLAGIDLRYVMTHLVSAERPDAVINADQLSAFAKVRAAFPAVPTSLANSSGIFLGPAFRSDLARPGAALYGVAPGPGMANPMHTVARLRVQIMQMRQVQTGQGVGYDHSWRATRPTRIATLPLGYADGYHRALGNKAEVFLHGAHYPLVGRVSMDLVTIDVTDCPEAAIGDWCEAIGPAVTPERLGELAGTNAYEILTSLGRRFQRVYRGA